MADITNIMGGEFVPPVEQQTKITDPPDVQLINQIIGWGYKPPSRIIFDGQIHRFHATEGKLSNDGWYVAHAGVIHAGAYGCWRDGFSTTWREVPNRKYTPAEMIAHTNRMQELKELSEKNREKKAETAADTSAAIWDAAADAENGHPYLVSKQVKSHGLKVTGDGRLIVPLLDSAGEIASLQFITHTGDKQFKGGGKSKGSFFYLGIITPQTKTVYLAEGYATAATIYEQTGEPCYIAFNAGNLSDVANFIRTHYQGDLCIVADNDSHGVGKRKADEAAAETRARVVMPPFEGMDANDYYQENGDLLGLLLRPKAESWIVKATEFAAQPKPIRWLIQNMLPAESLIMVHGQSGGGKTFCVLDMCCTLASNKPDWFGFLAQERKTVLYLAGEGHAGLAGRLKAWMIYNQTEDLDLYISKSGTDLNTPEGLFKVHESLGDIKPELIVVDTLHRFLLGDENSAQDAKTMLDACEELRKTYNCSVLLVHHTGVSDESQHRARGSSAWKGALDSEISVMPGRDGAPIEIIPRKAKDIELPSSFCAKLESVQLPWVDQYGESVSSAILIPAEKPVDNKTKKHNQEINTFIDYFNRAWESLGDVNSPDNYLFGCKYIRAAPLKDWLLDNGICKNEGTAKNYTKPSYTNGMVGKLIEEGLLRHEGGGFILLQSPDEAADVLLG